jgi:hypothetical protein
MPKATDSYTTRRVSPESEITDKSSAKEDNPRSAKSGASRISAVNGLSSLKPRAGPHFCDGCPYFASAPFRVGRCSLLTVVKPKQPAGPPMTLGNTRELGLRRVAIQL